MKLSKKIILLIALAFAGCKVSHNTVATPPPDTSAKPVKPVLNAVGITKPSLLKPGYVSMDDYIQKNVQYPDDAKKNNIQGTIMVTALIDTMGILSNVKADNDLGFGTGAAAEKVVQSMSPMSPAGNNGKVVRFHIKVPVNFTITKAFSNDSEEKLDRMYQNMPDVSAQYPGGATERDKFIQTNVKLPPSLVTEGTVFVTADVEITGELTHVRVVKPGIQDLDAAAIQVVQAMPKWTPASTLGHPVKSQVVITVDMKR